MLLKLRSTSRLVMLSKNLRIGTLARMTSSLVRKPVWNDTCTYITRERGKWAQATYGTVWGLSGLCRGIRAHESAGLLHVRKWRDRGPCRCSHRQSRTRLIPQYTSRIDAGSNSANDKLSENKIRYETRNNPNGKGMTRSNVVVDHLTESQLPSKRLLRLFVTRILAPDCMRQLEQD